MVSPSPMRRSQRPLWSRPCVERPVGQSARAPALRALPSAAGQSPSPMVRPTVDSRPWVWP
eukprot:scaffold21439_cov69-Phaeocystis_antarctica.AAC.5